MEGCILHWLDIIETDLATMSGELLPLLAGHCSVDIKIKNCTALAQSPSVSSHYVFLKKNLKNFWSVERLKCHKDRDKEGGRMRGREKDRIREKKTAWEGEREWGERVLLTSQVSYPVKWTNVLPIMIPMRNLITANICQLVEKAAITFITAWRR